MRAIARARTGILSTALVLFAGAVFLTAYSAKHPEVGRAGSAFLQNGIYPLLRLGGGLTGSTGSLVEEYLFLVKVEAENRKLRTLLGSLPTMVSKVDEVTNENKRLRRLLQMSEERFVQGPVASLIAFDASNWVEAGTVDKGARDGVKPRTAVITEAGVVGQTTVVGSSSAKVLFITDRSSGVDVLLQGSRARGVLRGRGRERLKLEYVDADTKVEIGDRVITSGLDQIYPKGFLVGLVAKVSRAEDGLFLDIEVEPSVRFGKIEEVALVQSVQNVDYEPIPVTPSAP